MPFKCPKGEGECEYFGKGYFCPYATIEELGVRRFAPDCPSAPKPVWRDFFTQEERISRWYNLEYKKGGSNEDKV